LILKIAFSSLVANRAIERVVGEKELHDTFTSLVNGRRVGLDLLSGPRGGRKSVLGLLAS
jgi:hypothetical protein